MYACKYIFLQNIRFREGLFRFLLIALRRYVSGQSIIQSTAHISSDPRVLCCENVFRHAKKARLILFISANFLSCFMIARYACRSTFVFMRLIPSFVDGDRLSFLSFYVGEKNALYTVCDRIIAVIEHYDYSFESFDINNLISRDVIWGSYPPLDFGIMYLKK